MRKKTADELAINGDKSGLKLPAHSTTLYESVYQVDTASLVVEKQLDSIKVIDSQVWVIGRLQFLFGLRISEVLSIKGCDIDGRGRIIIGGKKGSDSRLVADTELRKFWLSKRVLCTSLVFEVSRFYVYRLYKSVGLQSEVEGSLYKAVTHYPRHLFIKSVQNTTGNIDTTARITGHKQASNTKRYWKSKTK